MHQSQIYPNRSDNLFNRIIKNYYWCILYIYSNCRKFIGVHVECNLRWCLAFRWCLALQVLRLLNTWLGKIPKRPRPQTGAARLPRVLALCVFGSGAMSTRPPPSCPQSQVTSISGSGKEQIASPPHCLLITARITMQVSHDKHRKSHALEFRLPWLQADPWQGWLWARADRNYNFPHVLPLCFRRNVFCSSTSRTASRSLGCRDHSAPVY